MAVQATRKLSGQTEKSEFSLLKAIGGPWLCCLIGGSL